MPTAALQRAVRKIGGVAYFLSSLLSTNTSNSIISRSGVGEGWVEAARELNLERADIWLQTKFSGLNAHDPNNVPYDVNASLEDRVRQSLKKSLENLKTDYIDSWIMHGPEDSWDDHWKVSIPLSTGDYLGYAHQQLICIFRHPGMEDNGIGCGRGKGAPIGNIKLLQARR
jgi:hypothetical protein